MTQAAATQLLELPLLVPLLLLLLLLFLLLQHNNNREVRSTSFFFSWLKEISKWLKKACFFGVF
jgi:hypothetical protein